MKRLLLAGAGLSGAAAAAWTAFVRYQGDCHIVYDVSDSGGLRGLIGDDRSIHGEIVLRNAGKVGAVVHKVEGRMVSGPPGRVLATRHGSKPPERGWWQSNCLLPGESCVAEIDVELEEPATGPITIELDTHEVGRRLKVHRTVQLTLAVPQTETAALTS